MFRLILTVVVSLLHIYVFQRASTVPWISRHVPDRVLLAAGLLIWIAFQASVLAAPRDSSTLTGVLEFWSMIWMAMLFLLATTLLCADLLTLFGLLFRSVAPLLRGAALLAGLGLCALALVQGMRAPVVTKYEATLPGLPPSLDGTTVAVLTDLHLGAILGPKWLDARVKQVQALHPDLIAFVGDVFDHRPPTPAVAGGLRELSAPLGVWGVLGNHEMYMRDMELIESSFALSGIRLLRNDRAEVAPGLILAGVDDLSSRSAAANIPGYFAQALDGRPEGGTILLTHAPVGADLAASKGVGLLLAGHTHGGQIWPFGYLVTSHFPLFTGRYQIGPMTALVSRGVGTWGPRMRLWKPAQILLVTLRAEQEAAK